MSFFESMKLLFPRGKAFQMVKDGPLRRFVKGLSRLPEDIKRELDEVYLDLFPDTTRALKEWENQFATLFADEQYGGTRQEILKSLWQANQGGQSAQYLESLLQRIDKRILVVENVPIKNPRSSSSGITACCGHEDMFCGGGKSTCGYTIGNANFEPSVLRNDGEQVYDMPVDKKYWEQCFYVCGNVVRTDAGAILYFETLELDIKWRNYIEYLILKVKPVQMTAVIFIEWRYV